MPALTWPPYVGSRVCPVGPVEFPPTPAVGTQAMAGCSNIFAFFHSGGLLSIWRFVARAT